MAEAELFDPLLENKDDALRAFDRYCSKVWNDFGINPIVLEEEMQQRVEIVVPTRKGGKTIYVSSETWRGMGVTCSSTIHKYRVKIACAESIQELSESTHRAEATAHLVACYLWAREKCKGPNSSERLVKQATKAQNLAAFLRARGEDTAASRQEAKAQILTRIAAGEDLPLPKRAGGVVEKVRQCYFDLEKDGKPHIRAEYIAVGIAAGVHPGTCAVQYARWKKEKK